MKMFLALGLIFMAATAHADLPSEDPQVRQLIEIYKKTPVPKSANAIVDGATYNCLPSSALPGVHNPQLIDGKNIYYYTLALKKFGEVLMSADATFSFTPKGIFYQRTKINQKSKNEYIEGFYIRSGGETAQGDKSRMMIQRTMRPGKAPTSEVLNKRNRLTPGIDVFFPNEKLVEILDCEIPDMQFSGLSVLPPGFHLEPFPMP